MKIKQIKTLILTGVLAMSISAFAGKQCYEPKSPDWFVDEVMSKKTLHLVMQTMDDNGVKTDIKWVEKLANTLVRQSNEYIQYTKKNPKQRAWETVREGTVTCGVPNAVYQKGLDKKMLRKLNVGGFNVLHD